MPERNRTQRIVSQQEAKMMTRLARLLPTPQHGQEAYILHNSLPLTSLFTNEARLGWPRYIEDNLRGVIQVDESDFLTRGSIAWAPGSIPIFRWSPPSEEHPNGRAIFNTGGEYTFGLPVWDRRHVDSTRNWLRRVYSHVPESRIFIDAYTNSSTEEEMNSVLNANFPRLHSTPYDDRIRNLYSTSLDGVVVRDSGWHLPLESTSDQGHIIPAWGVEYDGLIGLGIVEGDLRWTEAYVGDIGGYRDDMGNIDMRRVDYRRQKVDDKVRILRDLRIPMVVLPHYALSVIGTGPNAWMMSDIALCHCHAISRILIHPRFDDDSWDFESRAMHIAMESFHPLGPNFGLRALRAWSSVVIERTEINLETQLESLETEDDDAPVSLLHGQYVRDRIRTHGYDQYSVAADYGLDPERIPGLRMTAENATLGTQSVEAPIPFGYGCSMLPEFDYVMTAGLAAGILHQRFADLNAEMYNNSGR